MLLDLQVNTFLGWIILIALILFVAYLFAEIKEGKKKLSESKLDIVRLQGEVESKNLRIEIAEKDAKGLGQQYAQKWFEEWKLTEMESYKKVVDRAGLETANALLNQWKIDNEKIIRDDAKKRSSSVLLGQLTEHLLPFSDHFKQFNFKDARFMGNPIDLIVFDGVEEKKDQITIHFIEIKTGTSALSKKQIQIRDAVKAKRVEWHLFNLKDFGGALTEEPVVDDGPPY